MQTELGAKQAERLPHHLELMSAIEAIAQVRNALRDLLSEMGERNEVPDGSGSLIAASNPPLLYVLQEGPKLIRTQIADCMALIQEIRDGLRYA
jgi:hypothetical protein